MPNIEPAPSHLVLSASIVEYMSEARTIWFFLARLNNSSGSSEPVMQAISNHPVYRSLMMAVLTLDVHVVLALRSRRGAVSSKEIAERQSGRDDVLWGDPSRKR